MSELDQIFARIDASYETTDKLVNYDIAKMAEEEFLFLSDLDLAMILTLEQRLRVRELFIEDKRYLGKVQDYLQELGFSKDEVRSLSLKVSNTFVASEQGRTQHDWYTFLAAGSFLDGAARIGQATGFLKDLHASWKAMNTAKKLANNSWYKPGNGLNYPPNNGAVPGTEKTVTLQPGQTLGRYGGIGSKSDYATNPNATPKSLALPPTTNTSMYTEIKILKPIPGVTQSTVAEWPVGSGTGGGIQYKFPMPLEMLKNLKYITY